MFLYLGGSEPDLWYNQSDIERWNNFFYTKRVGFPRVHTLIQQFMYQLKHLKYCNSLVKQHELKLGIKYTYKMRLRPDFAWIQPIPPISTIDLSPSNILISTKLFYGGGNEDTFGFGLSKTMDIYFDRFPFVHTYPTPNHTWTAEEFVSLYMLSNNIKLIQNNEFRTFPVMEKKASRGLSERSKFLLVSNLFKL